MPELLELEELELDELPELELLADELELDELEEPLGSTSQLAVKSWLTTQVKPLGHPQIEQSPGWHMRSDPQTSLKSQSAEVEHLPAGLQSLP